MKAVRIELRRSAAIPAALLIALVGCGMLYALGTSYSGDWHRMTAYVRYTLASLLWPIALGAASWQAARERRSGVGELLATTPRPAWHRPAVTTAVLAGAALAAYAAAVVVGAVEVRPGLTYAGGTWPAALAVGALALVAAVCVGMGLGRVLPWRFTAPLVTLGAMIWMLWLANTGSFISPHLDRGEDFTTIATGFIAGQAVWFAALAAGGLLLLISRRRLGQVAAAAPVAVGFAVAASLAAGAQYVPDPPATKLVCTPDAPRVCVSKAHAATLADLVPPARDALTLLGKKLPSAPKEVVEDTRGFLAARRAGGRDNPHTGQVPIQLERDQRRADGGLATPREDVRDAILEGGGAECRTSESAGDFAARRVIVAWLLGTAPTAPKGDPPGLEGVQEQAPDGTWQPATALVWKEARPIAITALATLRAAPPSEQARRVAAARASFSTCGSGTALSTLTKGTR